ncbi:MAG: aminobenzoyl-glutamate utilization protein [Bryobacterales bacterium]|jgi:metal-dependent amidase/aminoacylase/carboxypeptidase family protein|nr:aminobenzoyl-glutamate utilization protein [Bryobacterales bacterium]
MLRAGLFRDADVVLHWRPADHNAITNGGIAAAKLRFHGVSAHTAFAPDRGRSALDAAEANAELKRRVAVTPWKSLLPSDLAPLDYRRN